MPDVAEYQNTGDNLLFKKVFVLLNVMNKPYAATERKKTNLQTVSMNEPSSSYSIQHILF